MATLVEITTEAHLDDGRFVVLTFKGNIDTPQIGHYVYVCPSDDSEIGLQPVWRIRHVPYVVDRIAYSIARVDLEPLKVHTENELPDENIWKREWD